MDDENLGECHTWRAWGSRVRKKQLDKIMRPRDLVSTMWYLNKTRIRTWGPFSSGGEDRWEGDEGEERETRVGGLDTRVRR